MTSTEVPLSENLIRELEADNKRLDACNEMCRRTKQPPCEICGSSMHSTAFCAITPY